jgi:hypothetical protein
MACINLNNLYFKANLLEFKFDQHIKDRIIHDFIVIKITLCKYKIRLRRDFSP